MKMNVLSPLASPRTKIPTMKATEVPRTRNYEMRVTFCSSLPKMSSSDPIKNHTPNRFSL